MNWSFMDRWIVCCYCLQFRDTGSQYLFESSRQTLMCNGIGAIREVNISRIFRGFFVSRSVQKFRIMSEGYEGLVARARQQKREPSAD